MDIPSFEFFVNPKTHKEGSIYVLSDEYKKEILKVLDQKNRLPEKEPDLYKPWQVNFIHKFFDEEE